MVNTFKTEGAFVHGAWFDTGPRAANITTGTFRIHRQCRSYRPAHCLVVARWLGIRPIVRSGRFAGLHRTAWVASASCRQRCHSRYRYVGEFTVGLRAEQAVNAPTQIAVPAGCAAHRFDSFVDAVAIVIFIIAGFRVGIGALPANAPLAHSRAPDRRR